MQQGPRTLGGNRRRPYLLPVPLAVMLMLAGGAIGSTEFYLFAHGPADGLDVTVNGEHVGGVQTRAVVAGDRIGTRDTVCLLRFTPTTRAMLGPHVDCEITGPVALRLSVGQAYLEGPVVVMTPTCHVRSGSGAVAVRVNLAGETTVGAVSGTVIVSVGARELSVAENEAVTVMADNGVLGPGNADPLQVVYSLPFHDSDDSGLEDINLDAPENTREPAAGQVAGREAPSAEIKPAPEQEAAVATSGEQWNISAPDVVAEAVVCRGVDPNNRPIGVGRTFPGSLGHISLYLQLNLGTTPHQVRISWSRGSRQLAGRIVRASGHREILNSLSAREGGDFPPGDYRVTVHIDDRPAATLDFTVREGD